jgi:hypothetical protein
MVHTVGNNDELAEWLSSHGEFEDGCVLALDPMPSTEGLPPTVAKIDLAYLIEGNYKAHSRAVYRAFRLTADGLSEYSLAADGGFYPDNCIMGVELLDASQGVAFLIEVPARMIVRCAKLNVVQLPDLVVTVKPWVSEREVYAEVPTTPIPSPQEWVRLFQQSGVAVSWHIYGESATECSEVPQKDYQGWFLQASSEPDKTRQGVFFFSCRPQGNGFRVHIQNSAASASLWRAAKIVLGGFRNATVHCGNCEFSSSEWMSRLALPDQPT